MASRYDRITYLEIGIFREPPWPLFNLLLLGLYLCMYYIALVYLLISICLYSTTTLASKFQKFLPFPSVVLSARHKRGNIRSRRVPLANGLRSLAFVLYHHSRCLSTILSGIISRSVKPASLISVTYPDSRSFLTTLTLRRILMSTRSR